MRTTVYTNPSDPDETDEWPECVAAVDPESGELLVLEPDSTVVAAYGAGEWETVEVTAA